MSIISKDYFAYEVAAARMQLSPESVRRYIHAKKIAAEPVGRTYYIHQSEIDRYNAERKPVGRPPESSEK